MLQKCRRVLWLACDRSECMFRSGRTRRIRGALWSYFFESRISSRTAKFLPRQWTDNEHSSYPTTWNGSLSHIPASGPGSYPSTTIASDPYQKMPLSGAPGFTAEPSEMAPQMPTSMPSMQLSMVSNPNDQQQQHQQQAPPIRTQYASYVQPGTAAPSNATGQPNNSLSVPRYVDDNHRPVKSPRHASHPSVHSASSIANTDASNEYRYGPPYVGVTSSSTDTSQYSAAPYSAQHQPAGQDTSQHQQHAQASQSTSAQQQQQQQQPSRDYYPSPNSWTTTAGESSAPTYTNGDHRSSYPFNDGGYKTAGVKTEHLPPPSVYPGHNMNHYSYNTT